MKTKQKTQSTITEISKSQKVRLIDVFFIAPFLFYIAYKASGISDIERIILFIIALATLYYNGRNYISNKVNSHIGYVR